MQKSTQITGLLAIIVLIGFGCSQFPEKKSNSAEIDRGEILSEARKNGLIMNEKEIVRMSDVGIMQHIDGINPVDVEKYLSLDVSNWKSAALADVSGGGSFGLAFYNNTAGEFTLIAKMGNLPVLEDGFRYEGWLVQRGKEMHTINTGSVIAAGDQYVNIFVTQTDLSAYNFFVLTRESDSEDPAPSEHVLEGSFR